MHRSIASTVVSFAALMLIGLSWAQSTAQESVSPVPESAGEFQFVRLAYSQHPNVRGSWTRQMWRTDYPEAEQHFLNGVSRQVFGHVAVEICRDVESCP